VSRLGLALPLLAALFFASSARAESKSVPVGGACQSDAQCVLGSICTDGVCTALPKERRILPFYWHRPGESGSLHLPILLYFSTWDRESKVQVQVPFFARTQNFAERSSTTIVPPLLFWAGTYEGRGAQVGWMPFFYWQKKGPQKWLVIPPLGSGGQRNEQQDLTEAVIALVGYYRRHHDDTWSVFFPLVWNHATRTSRSTFVLPLGYFHKDEKKSTDVFFPLVWHFANHELGTRHLLVLPLFDFDSDRFGRRQLLISPVAAWERNDAAKLRQLVLFAPPLFHRRDALRDIDVAPPLFVRWRVHDDGSRGVIAFPFVHAADPEGSTTALFPVFWRFWDRKTNAETDLLLPLVGVHKSPTTTGAFVGPVYGWRTKPSPSNPEGGWGGGVAPLAMFGRRGARSHALVLPPLFERFSDAAAGSSTTLVGPVFAHARAHGSGWDAGLFPLLWFGSGEGRGYALLPPVFYYRATRTSSTTVVGPVVVRSFRDGWSAGLWPLAFFGHRGDRSHQVLLPPLFVRVASPTTDRLLVGPFYHGRDGERRVDALFPLFYLRRAPHDGLLVGPLVGWRSTATAETVVVGPYVYRRNDETGARTHALFPLFIKHDAPDYHVVVQFPFFWRVHDGKEIDTTIFPLYFRVRSPERQIDSVPLLGILHANTTVASTTIAGPFWWRARRDGGRQAGLFPLFAYGRVQKDERSSSWLGMPGAFWMRNDFNGTEKLWATLFFREKHEGGWTAGLIPLVFAWKRGTATKVVTPIYYRQADAAADYALDVLGPIWWGHTAEQKRFGLFPLTFARWKPDGTFATGLFPLFYWQKKHLGSVFATLVFGWSTYATGWRAYAGPLYFRRDAERSSTALLPIFYHSRNHVTGGSTSFLLPLWLDLRGADGRQLQEYTPLVWRFHSVERSVIVGLPLFVDIHNFHESRSTTFLPLFVRHTTEVEKYTEWVFPPILTWVRKHHDEEHATDFALFPLIWRFGGTNSTTVVAPLFWDFKRGGSRTTVLFPLFARWTREEADHLLFLNMYYRRGKGPFKEGSWYVDVFPLAEFGRPRKHDVTWKVLEGLFGYSRLGRNRILHLFWFIDIALEPAPASSLSWWSSTPPSARTEF